MKDPVSRRHMLAALGAGGAALSLPSVGRASMNQPRAGGDCPDALAQAEHFLGVSYTDAERAQLDDTVEGYLDRIRLRRAAFAPENSQPPALTFDPLLKHGEYKPQRNRVRLEAGAAGQLPARDDDIAFAPLWKQAQWLRHTALTSERLTRLYLDRIAKYAGRLECFATVTGARALARARQADQELAAGKDRGPLHGIPYGLKDLIDTAGVRTAWGAAPYQDRTPMKNAEIVTRLEAAGAVMLGKTTLGALAYGDKWYGGVTRNPWAPEEGSSGSSAGSAAATAAGLASFAIGTETLGSIVSPSARCGVAGLRPTFGRVPRSGAMALCWSLDKIGPLCRYVEDTALVLAVLNGADGADAASLDWGFEYDGGAPVAGLTVGYDPAWFEKAPKGDLAVLDILKNAGVALREIRLPDLPYSSLLSILEAEAAAAFEELTLSNRDDLLSWQEDVAWPNTFRAARFHSAVEILQLDRFRRHIMEMMNDLFRNMDMMISAPQMEDLLYITNYTGHPCLTLPVGLEDRQTLPLTGRLDAKPGPVRRLPRNMVLWGNMLREDQLVRVGRLVEKTVNFHQNNRPEMTG